MKNFLATVRKIKLPDPPDLPTLGIFAFALASTWSLYNLFNSSAIHPTWLYWIPAVLVEVVTAWLTGHIVEAVHQLTRSNALKQDLRFFRIVAIVSSGLVIPTFGASILANLYEFQGQWWLALLFPVGVVGCAIGAQIPRSVARYKSAGDDKSKTELRKIRGELKQSRAELKQVRAEFAQANTEIKRLGDLHTKRVDALRISEERLAQVREELTRAKQRSVFKRADKTAYTNICAGLNGSAPTTPRGVNDLLNEQGYYAVPDSTARTWAKKGEMT